MLHKLVFDPTDADSRADSAQVGAYLLASDGTLITSTSGALDVNIGAVADLDIRDLTDGSGNTGFDQVRIGDGTNTLAVDASGQIAVTQGTDSPWTVDGTVSISGDVNVTQGTSPWVIGDGGGSITVDATALDIRALSQATDSIQAWTFDGAGNSIGSTAGALDVNIASGDIDDDLANTALVTGSTSVDTTLGGTDLRATDLANRKHLFVYNNGNKTVSLGTTGVTAATGFPLPPGAMIPFRAGPAIDMYAISSAGTQDIRTLELS